jgi:large subunit ribosomal protein L21
MLRLNVYIARDRLKRIRAPDNSGGRRKTMYAIVETGGKQYRVQEGDILKVESLGLEEGQSVVFDKVLLVGKDDAVTVGAPYVQGASVTASVTGNGKDPKILVFKFKSKKNYRRMRGHRQHYSEIHIDSLTAGV